MQQIRAVFSVLLNKKYRPFLTAGILITTILVIGRFFVLHPQYITELKHVRPGIVAALIVLYACNLGILAWAYDAMLRLCDTHLPFKENMLLTAYSTIANFFGPLQSGPGVRAVYLKTRHNVRLRDYTVATLIYYGIFATFSALFLLVGARPWWQTLFALLVVAGSSSIVIRWFIKQNARKSQSEASRLTLRAGPLAHLACATFLQLTVQVVIYFIELSAINPSVHFAQAISYGGAANFALFVSLTPGAIGFRESFLVFSREIHHITTATILSANIIDRSVYMVFLALLFLLVVSIHAQDKLQLRGWWRVRAKPE